MSVKKMVGGSVKGSLKAGVKGAYNPYGGTKDSLVGAYDDTVTYGKKDLNLNKPKADTSAQDQLLADQRTQQADLDSEENRRRKRLLSAATGVRAFAGSPLFRASPSNTAGRAAAAAASVSGASAGGSAGGASGVSTAGGYRGGGGGTGGRRGRSLLN